MPRLFHLERLNKKEELNEDLKKYSGVKPTPERPPRLFHERPPIVEKKILNKELKEYPELKAKLTFSFPLNENRKEALKMIYHKEKINEEKVMKLLESKDFIERKVGVYLLKDTSLLSDKNYKKTLPILEGMIKNGDLYVQEAIARAKVKLIVDLKGEKALPILEKMIKHGNGYVQEAVAQVLPEFGEKALPILEKMIKNRDWVVQKAAAQVLPEFGEKALPILEKMIKHGNWVVQEAIARAKVKLIVDLKGKKALPILEKMIKDGNGYIQEAVAQVLPEFGEKALPILEKIIKYGKWDDVQEIAKISLMKIKGGYKWLLATQKPLFATPYTPELAERILKIKKITDGLRKGFKDEEIPREIKEKFKDNKKILEELKNGFKDKFVGLIIFGSTAKGYFKPGSDLDWAIITQSRECSSIFKKMAKNLKLCIEHYVGINEKYQIQANEHNLFQGLFFGDKEKLLEVQSNFLDRINEEKWDEVRKIIMKNEVNLFRAEGRFNLNKDEIEKITQASLLLRVPPTLKETREILENKKGG